MDGCFEGRRSARWMEGLIDGTYDELMDTQMVDGQMARQETASIDRKMV